MWPFKKSKGTDDQYEECRMLIDKLSFAEAKFILIQLTEILGNKIIEIEKSTAIPSFAGSKLSSTTLDFIQMYKTFSPRFMDLVISHEYFGMSELDPEYVRIGYNMEWSEILESPLDSKIFTAYSDSNDKNTPLVRDDLAESVWHYLLFQLATIYSNEISSLINEKT